MKSRTLILTIVLVILVGAGVGWWFVSQRGEGPSNDNAGNTANGTTNVNKTPNFGALVVERQAVYQGVTFDFTTASMLPAYNGQTAGDGKIFLVVYYRPIEDRDAAGSVSSLVANDVALTAAGEKRYTIREVKVVTSVDGHYDEGYLWFEVDADAADFALQFGGGDEPYVVDLNI